MKKKGLFERVAYYATKFTGSTAAFIIAFLVIIAWLVTGPLFDFSDTWQLVINTSTTIITFLMVFLIQRTQNKDSKAIHLKLNELIASLKEPSNRMVDVEDLSEEELDTLATYYQNLALLAKKEGNIFVSHSIDEAHARHRFKHGSKTAKD
jgi:low affinity Fe/Cu permease